MPFPVYAAAKRHHLHPLSAILTLCTKERAAMGALFAWAQGCRIIEATNVRRRLVAGIVTLELETLMMKMAEKISVFLSACFNISL
jgi:hypothetical protein